MEADDPLKSRGFGFVTFTTAEALAAAVGQMDVGTCHY
jgi:hypothetical protein